MTIFAIETEKLMSYLFCGVVAVRGVQDAIRRRLWSPRKNPLLMTAEHRSALSQWALGFTCVDSGSLEKACYSFDVEGHAAASWTRALEFVVIGNAHVATTGTHIFPPNITDHSSEAGSCDAVGAIDF